MMSESFWRQPDIETFKKHTNVILQHFFVDSTIRNHPQQFVIVRWWYLHLVIMIIILSSISLVIEDFWVGVVYTACSYIGVVLSLIVLVKLYLRGCMIEGAHFCTINTLPSPQKMVQHIVNDNTSL